MNVLIKCNNIIFQPIIQEKNSTIEIYIVTL